MDLFKQGMKNHPARPAPAVPSFGVNRYSPVTNWNDDPFGADVFEPSPHFAQKKKPPPRPPPPRVNTKQPDLPSKPSHFIRKPTVLSSLLSRKNKSSVNNTSAYVNNQSSLLTDFNSEMDATKMFPKCEPKNVNTGALIDLSSPPSSPTFTTRSSSDGLSVDSFGSDATTSTNHHNPMNGGNASQAESGFEDDFDLFLTSRKTISKEDTLDDFTTIDPFSPPVASTKPPIMKKPVISSNFYDTSSSQPPLLKGPTIIRAKPARPKAPASVAILKNTLGNNMPITTMNVNTTVPIHKISNGFGDSFETKPFSWDTVESSPERDSRESSPPMPSIPPPPPPAIDDDVTPAWPQDDPEEETMEPYGIALFDYFTDHPDDLSFSVGAKIKLIRRENDEWLFGSLRSGAQGLLPANYVDIKVPLQHESVAAQPAIGTATALYDFTPVEAGDLGFSTGDTITVLYKSSNEWYFGECNGTKGQFPVNYVQMN